jgi:acyl-coenzyme A synthetase/AMP-(fatty) acid ligase
LLDADISAAGDCRHPVGHGPLSAELAAQTRSNWACPVLEIYGSTETGQVATRETAVETTWQTLQGIALEQRDDELWAVGAVYETRKC